MRKILFSIIAFISIVVQVSAQQPDTGKIDSFITNTLPHYNSYFSTAYATETGVLVLTALDAYNTVNASIKQSVMNNITRLWADNMVIVKYGTKNELWAVYEEPEGSRLLYGWDMNSANPGISPVATITETGKHPFFVYVGGQGILDSEKNLNAAINTRVGFFLLKNRWDLAWTFSGGISGVADTSAVFTNRLSTGIMSKFYFPIPKLNISPNVGVDLQSTLFINSEGSESTAASRSILAGIAWYIGPGSLDAGVRINKEPSVTIGYTFMPGRVKKK